MFNDDAHLTQAPVAAIDATKSTVQIVREALEARLSSAMLLLQEAETLPAGPHREEAIDRILRRIAYANRELGKLT